MTVTQRKSDTKTAASVQQQGDKKLQATLAENHPMATDLSVIKHPEDCDKVKPHHVYVGYSQVHWARKKEIAEKYPQVRELVGPDFNSAIYSVLLVAFQLVCAIYIAPHLSLIPFILMFYCVGAVADHAMWVLIHDATHDLIFKKPVHNTAFHLFLNLPLVFPSTVSFRMYHRQHHSHLNETYADPDLPGPWEQILGRNAPSKLLWIILFPLFMSVRVVRYQQEFDWWILSNWLIQMPVNILLYFYAGPSAFLYLLLSSIFALGLHPMGARWIAEHYATHPEQETYSYYGSGNLIAFNIGYHNEHHDMPTVPWSRLPALTKLAPEFYNTLHTHNSYIGVMWRFIMDPNFTLASRVVRPSRGSRFENMATHG